MKKTLTAALAISAIASLALATEISTSNVAVALDLTEAAGFSGFISNPLGAKLGDIDGSATATSGAKIRVINPTGIKAFDAVWYNGGWKLFENSNYTDSMDNYVLSRGQSVQFIVPSNGEAQTLYVAGILNEDNISPTLATGAYNFLGNASVSDKTLADITVANLDSRNGDYVWLSGNRKLAFYNNKWYDYAAFRQATTTAPTEVSASTVTIPAGSGFYVYLHGKTRSATPSITLTGAL